MEHLDVEAILNDLGAQNPAKQTVLASNSVTFDSSEAGMNNAQWLSRMEKQRGEVRDAGAMKVAGEIAARKRRTLQWLGTLGYQGVLDLWRGDTRGLIAVIEVFEEETGEDFSASLVLDFMESHDSWPVDAESIFRTHALMHEGNWQDVAANASTMDMQSVTKAKQLSTLMFERAGTLNREKFSKVVPREDVAQGNVINVVINKDGANMVGVARQQIAHRQQLTARARQRYGTSRYVDPPGIEQWWEGELEIPHDKVDDYLMLKWVPDNVADVIQDSVVEVVQEEGASTEPVESPVMIDGHNLMIKS